MLKVKLLNHRAKLPFYVSKGAACFDISASIEKNIYVAPFESEIINTGLAVEIESGYVLLLFSRSGHGFKNGIRLSNCVGIIDSDYRGEIKAKIHNDRKGTSFVVENHQRILQGIVIEAKQIEIKEIKELSNTIRGAAGLGSTGY